MGWACGANGWGEGVYRVLLRKPEGRTPLGRLRRRWVDNIRMDFQEVGCGYVDWIGLAQDRDRWRTLVRAVVNLRVPWNAGNFLTICKPVSFSRKTLHHGVGKYIYRMYWRLNLQSDFDFKYFTCPLELHFLGSFMKMRKAITSSVIFSPTSDCLSAWADFHEIWYLGGFRKIYRRNLCSLETD